MLAAPNHKGVKDMSEMTKTMSELMKKMGETMEKMEN